MSIIAANWKMHKTKAEAREFILKLIPHARDISSEIIIFAPSIYLSDLQELAFGTNISIGAQNCFSQEKGAFTGEISPQMLLSMDIHDTIIGHSERRMYFGDTNETVKARVHHAVKSGMRVILCVGEDEKTRETNTYFEHVSTQIKSCFFELDAKYYENIIIAYEPIWAIGTGTACKKEDAEKMCAFIKELVKSNYDYDIKVLYGGSANEKNIKELINCPSIDGALIGSASLELEKLVEMMLLAEY